MKTSVVICAFTEERWEHLVQAITSLQQQSTPPLEIIVVVDHNRALFERVRARFPTIVVCENTNARGLSGARNSGIAIARGEWVAFLDDDAQAPPDWLAQLEARYDTPNVVGVGGAIEPRFETARPAWLPREFDWVIGCTYVGMPEHVAPVRNLIGCNMAFRRDAFDAVGGFRTDVGQVGASMLRCDETDFCIRLHQHAPASKLLYVPQARVYHHVSANRTRWQYFRTRCYTEGLAKGALAQSLGASDSLSSEWTYTRRVLPRGFFRALGDAFLRRDVSGLARAGAIVAGLGLTALGFLRARLVNGHVSND